MYYCVSFLAQRVLGVLSYSMEIKSRKTVCKLFFCIHVEHCEVVLLPFSYEAFFDSHRLSESPQYSTSNLIERGNRKGKAEAKRSHYEIEFVKSMQIMLTERSPFPLRHSPSNTHSNMPHLPIQHSGKVAHASIKIEKIRRQQTYRMGSPGK